MKWIDFKQSSIKPDNESWVVIKTALKHVPDYEVCYYVNDEWYLPANDDSCREEDIVKWTYIRED